MKKVILVFVFIVCCFTLKLSWGQSSDFNSFKNNFSQLEFPFVVGDEPLKNNKDIFSKKIGRNDIQKYLSGIKERTTPKSVYHYGGGTCIKGYTILIYRITDFGDAPALDTIRINLVVLNSDAKILSKMTIGGQYGESEIINCVLNKDLTFTVSVFNESNQLLSKKEYFINAEGSIKTTVSEVALLMTDAQSNIGFFFL